MDEGVDPWRGGWSVSVCVFGRGNVKCFSLTILHYTFLSDQVYSGTVSLLVSAVVSAVAIGQNQEELKIRKIGKINKDEGWRNADADVKA